jgi:hypothetical protein
VKVYSLAYKTAGIFGAAPFRTMLFADLGYGQRDYYYGIVIAKYFETPPSIYRLEINRIGYDWPDDFDVPVSIFKTVILEENPKSSLFDLIDMLKEQ